MRQFISICLIYSLLALTANGQYEGETITEGVGIDDLKVGETTRDVIVARYGDDYELIVHKKYSFELDYASKGMSFYFCQADPKQEVFVIELSYPNFSGVTSKGAILGQSTRRQVAGLYKDEEPEFPMLEIEKRVETAAVEETVITGENLEVTIDESDLKIDSSVIEDEEDSFYGAVSFKGIEFEYGTIDGYGGNVLTSIDVIEKSGLRQCDSKFGKLKENERKQR